MLIEFQKALEKVIKVLEYYGRDYPWIIEVVNGGLTVRCVADAIKAANQYGNIAAHIWNPWNENTTPQSLTLFTKSSYLEKKKTT